MTDPIEQARYDVKQALAREANHPDTASRTKRRRAWKAHEQAILRYHPGVVRLVKAARDYHMWHDRDINDWNATHEKAWSEVHYRRDVLEPLVAALVPFTTEEESE